MDDLNLGSSDVVVGHSSGALLAMRLLEGERKIKGAVLVACAHTDLGDENERASQYFDGDWQFEKMRDNAGEKGPGRKVCGGNSGEESKWVLVTLRTLFFTSLP